MMRFNRIAILGTMFTMFLTNIKTNGQTLIFLRDLTFNVPDTFYIVDTSQIEPKPKYSAYHEYGLLITDSSNLGSFPRISYMYLEVPGFGYDSSSVVLHKLNKNTDQEFHYDTLGYFSDKLISIGRFKLYNYTVYESKLLGRFGWFDIFYYSENEYNQKDYNLFLDIIHSVKFTEKYVNLKEKTYNDNKPSTLLLFGSLLVFIIVYILRKILKT